MFYEIAYKDATQPRICKCITTQKKLVDTPEGQEVLDAFTIECGGKPFKSDLHFGVTPVPGVFEGTWKQGLNLFSNFRWFQNSSHLPRYSR
jgi:hypothetical protein